MINSLEEAVRELYLHHYSRTGSFQNQLFDLIWHADQENLNKISLGFPYQVQAFKLWQVAGNNGDDLFRACGLIPQIDPLTGEPIFQNGVQSG